MTQDIAGVLERLAEECKFRGDALITGKWLGAVLDSIASALPDGPAICTTANISLSYEQLKAMEGAGGDTHLGILDDMEHDAKYETGSEARKTEMRIQALGASISRRDWQATEQAYAAIRDNFYLPRQRTS